MTGHNWRNNWIAWPVAMIPMAAIGFFLALRVWNAKPKPKTPPPAPPKEHPEGTGNGPPEPEETGDGPAEPKGTGNGPAEPAGPAAST